MELKGVCDRGIGIEKSRIEGCNRGRCDWNDGIEKGANNLEGGEIEESKTKGNVLDSGGINPRILTPKEKFELESVYEIEFRFKDRCTPRILESSEHLLQGAEQGG